VTSQYYILVADDDPTVRRVIVRVVQRIAPHATVIEAGDGVQALAALQQYHFSAIITDYHMPGASALNILEAVRAQHPSLPVVVVSAQPNVEQAARAAGATAFLAKPFPLEQLTATLQSVLP
jgi:CheY-like chemotaxis protein